MSDENLHWSERAKLANSSGHPPVYVPPKPPPRKSNRKYVFAGIGVLLVAVIAVAVVMLMPGGESTASTPGSSVTTLSTLVTRAATPPSSTAESRQSFRTRMTLYEDAISGFSFEYPASWVQFAPEQLVGATVPLPGAVGVGDPNGASFGSTPANCVAFVPHVATEEELKEDEGERDRTLSAELDEAAAWWESQYESLYPEESPLQLVEPTTSLSVNGMEVAEKTYRLLAQGHWMRWRLVLAESGPYWYILFMYTEEERVDKYWPVFDQMIDSLKLGQVM